MDISGEQTSTKLVNFLTSKGIRSELVPHANSPQANPAERQLQTLFRRVLVVQLAAQLPHWLWDELADAINKVDATVPVRDNPHWAPPDALITGTKPDTYRFKVLGCLGFVHTPAGTLEPKALHGTVVGYALWVASIQLG